MVAQAQPQTVAINNIVISTCQKCGAEIPHSQLNGGIDAQQRIEELEAQVKILTLRATEAGECLSPSLPCTWLIISSFKSSAQPTTKTPSEPLPPPPPRLFLPSPMAAYNPLVPEPRTPNTHPSSQPQTPSTHHRHPPHPYNPPPLDSPAFSPPASHLRHKTSVL